MTVLALALSLACGQLLHQGTPPGSSSVTRAAAVGPSPEERFSTLASEVNASDAVDELIDDLAADLARLGLQISPMLIDRIRVSDNLNPSFAVALEARIAAAVLRSATIDVVRCLECRSTRSRVEAGTWVVSKGLARKADLVSLASQYQSKAVLSVSLSMRTDPDSLALDAELVRATDSSIVFAETYRFDAATALLYRGADHSGRRAEKLADLEDRIKERPRFGHEAFFGAMRIPSTAELGPILGSYGGYRMYEKFGPEREYRMALQLGAFFDLDRLAGAVLTASIWRQLLGDHLYAPTLLFGLEAGAFLTGTIGNTPIVGADLQLQLGHRFAIQMELAYVKPFHLKDDNNQIGGLSPHAGIALIW